MKQIDCMELWHEGAVEADFDGLFPDRDGTVRFCYRDHNRVVAQSLNGRREVWYTPPEGEELELPQNWIAVAKNCPPALRSWYPSTSEIYYYSDHTILHSGPWSYVCRYNNKTVWTFRGYAGRHTGIERYADNIYFGTAGHGGYFYLLNLYTGQPLLKLKTGGTVNMYARRDDRLYLLQQDRKAYLVCIDLNDGSILERLELPGRTTERSMIRLIGNTIHAVTFTYNKNGSLKAALWNRIDAALDQSLDYVLDFAAGRYSYGEFESLFLHHPEIWDRVQELLTEEMIADRNHPVWEKMDRCRLESNSFAVRATALAFGYDQYGQVITWNIISTLVKQTFPDAKIREPVEASGEDLMERLGLEDLGGPEVDGLIREIVDNHRDIRPMKEQNRLLKQKLKEIFHIKPRKKPDWVQEPEWPMGEYSPMEFVSRDEWGSLVRWTFRDVDNGEERVVEQSY